MFFFGEKYTVEVESLEFVKRSITRNEINKLKRPALICIEADKRMEHAEDTQQTSGGSCRHVTRLILGPKWPAFTEISVASNLSLLFTRYVITALCLSRSRD